MLHKIKAVSISIRMLENLLWERWGENGERKKRSKGDKFTLTSPNPLFMSTSSKPVPLLIPLPFVLLLLSLMIVLFWPVQSLLLCGPPSVSQPPLNAIFMRLILVLFCSEAKTAARWTDDDSDNTIVCSSRRKMCVICPSVPSPHDHWYFNWIQLNLSSLSFSSFNLILFYFYFCVIGNNIHSLHNIITFFSKCIFISFHYFIFINSIVLDWSFPLCVHLSSNGESFVSFAACFDCKKKKKRTERIRNLMNTFYVLQFLDEELENLKFSNQFSTFMRQNKTRFSDFTHYPPFYVSHSAFNGKCWTT